MQKIYEMDKIRQLESSFKKIFKNKNPFEDMFNDSVEEKLLLCPTEGYFLTEVQFNALQKTYKEIGEKEVVISITEYKEMFSLNSKHWKLNGTIDYYEYIKGEIYLENAIYSSKGNWGLLISHEGFAVLGGARNFINIFKKYYTTWEEDNLHFRKIWESNQQEYGSDLSWINAFQKHLNIILFK